MRLRLDLSVATETELEAEAARLAALGASRVEGSTETPGSVTLIDPDGNEFQVLVRA